MSVQISGFIEINNVSLLYVHINVRFKITVAILLLNCA